MRRRGENGVPGAAVDVKWTTTSGLVRHGDKGGARHVGLPVFVVWLLRCAHVDMILDIFLIADCSAGRRTREAGKVTGLAKVITMIQGLATIVSNTNLFISCQ